jgi:hypothetical protein
VKRFVIRAIQTVLLFTFAFGLFGLTAMLWGAYWSPFLVLAMLVGLVSFGVAWILDHRIPPTS